MCVRLALLAVENILGCVLIEAIENTLGLGLWDGEEVKRKCSQQESWNLKDCCSPREKKSSRAAQPVSENWNIREREFVRSGDDRLDAGDLRTGLQLLANGGFSIVSEVSTCGHT